MKILENKQVRGILVGVVFGLIAAFTLQAFDVALWVFLPVGILLGLEVGWFAVSPRETWRAHARAVAVVNAKLKLQGVNAENNEFWLNVLVTIFAIVICGAQVVFAFISCNWLMNLGGGGSFAYTSIGFLIAFGATAGAAHLFLPHSGARQSIVDNFVEYLGLVSNYRKRIMFSLSAAPIGGVVLSAFAMVWFALLLALLPVYLVAALCALARGSEGVVMTVGITVGVIAGIIYGDLNDFALIGEIVACLVGAVVGLAVGALVTLASHEKVGGWFRSQYFEYFCLRPFARE